MRLSAVGPDFLLLCRSSPVGDVRRDLKERGTPLCFGFSFVIDLDFDQRGNLYVLEHASGPNGPFAGTSGQLVRVRRDRSATPVRTGLQAPMSVAIGPDGDACVSLNGTTPTNGEVRRIGLGTHHHGNHRGNH